jgi:hypothetical protein
MPAQVRQYSVYTTRRLASRRHRLQAETMVRSSVSPILVVDHDREGTAGSRPRGATPIPGTPLMVANTPTMSLDGLDDASQSGDRSCCDFAPMTARNRAKHPSGEGHEQHLQAGDIGRHGPTVPCVIPDPITGSAPVEFSDTTGWLASRPVLRERFPLRACGPFPPPDVTGRPSARAPSSSVRRLEGRQDPLRRPPACPCRPRGTALWFQRRQRERGRV